MKPRLCIDFDATIYDGHDLMPGCLAALNKLHERFWLAVFSSRATDNERYRMIAFIKDRGLPIDEVLPPKPEAEYYLDDKGRQFISWEHALEQLL